MFHPKPENSIMTFLKEKPIFTRVLLSIIISSLIGFFLDSVYFGGSGTLRESAGRRFRQEGQQYFTFGFDIDFRANFMGEFMILFILIGVFAGFVWGLRYKKII